jgi:hypothetical protein
MKLIEKILLGVAATFFMLQFASFTGKFVLFFLSCFVLALLYAIRGYKIFGVTNKKSRIISVLAGIGFATSLILFPYTLLLRQDTLIIKILPLVNCLFLLIVGAYVFINRKKDIELMQNTKGIFVRSIIILVITSFFTYCPPSFIPYRKIMIAINQDNQSIVNNLTMFEYSEKFEEALKKGDCDLAIQNAEMSNQYGKDWLQVKPDDNGNFSQKDSVDFWMIGKTFNNLYEAYKCKAKELYNKEKYEEALQLYIRADRNLYITNDIKTIYWEIEKAYSLNSIALCYEYISDYDKAEILFANAITQYKTIRDTNDVNVVTFLNNIAELLTNMNDYKTANQLYVLTTTMLKDTSNPEIKDKLIDNYLLIIKNHIKCDSLEKALFYLDHIKNIVGNNTKFCFIKLYYSMCYYKMSKYVIADSLAKECLACSISSPEQNPKNIDANYLILAHINMALAKYDLVKEYIDNGVSYTIKNNGRNNSTYADYLKLKAHLNIETGNYTEPGNQFKEAHDIYINEYGEHNKKEPALLSDMAHLEIILGRFNNAKTYADAALSIAKEIDDLQSPGSTSLLNDIAYVNYSTGRYVIADTLYKKVLHINQLNGFEEVISSAIALNGLGLIATEKKKTKLADSLFTRSISLHKEILGEDHPYTAVVYLNYAILKTNDNKLSEAKELLNKSYNINKLFFNNQHDVFADINMKLGDVAIKEKNNSEAKKYCQLAFDIYLKKFGKEHYNTLLAESKLKRL